MVREGINPQSRLQYLSAYLGHRNIHSTLVYLTITQELLQHANERFRTAEAEVLKVIQEDLNNPKHDLPALPVYCTPSFTNGWSSSGMPLTGRYWRIAMHGAYFCDSSQRGRSGGLRVA